MEKILIKDIPSFCLLSKSIEGKIQYRLKDVLNLSEENSLIAAHQNLDVDYFFQGFKKGDNFFYLKGFWSTSIQVYCSFCAQAFVLPLRAHYDPIRLIDEKQSSLECEEDSQECRFDIFDIAPWIFSELMVMVPLAPKHEECSTIHFD